MKSDGLSDELRVHLNKTLTAVGNPEIAASKKGNIFLSQLYKSVTLTKLNRGNKNAIQAIIKWHNYNWTVTVDNHFKIK